MANQSSEPKRPTFVHWMRSSGQLTKAEIVTLSYEWVAFRRERTDHKGFITGPITWDQFVASKYPRKVLVYQAYLRIIGATPTFKKDW